MSSSNTRSTLQEKQSGLNDLVWEMRRDLKIKPSEKESQNSKCFYGHQVEAREMTSKPVAQPDSKRP